MANSVNKLLQIALGRKQRSANLYLEEEWDCDGNSHSDDFSSSDEHDEQAPKADELQPGRATVALRLSDPMTTARSCVLLGKAISRELGYFVTVSVSLTEKFSWNPTIVEAMLYSEELPVREMRMMLSDLVGMPIALWFGERSLTTGAMPVQSVVIESATDMVDQKAKQSQTPSRKIRRRKTQKTMIEAIQQYRMVDDTVCQLRDAETEIEDYVLQMQRDERAAVAKQAELDTTNGGQWRRLYLMGYYHLARRAIDVSGLDESELMTALGKMSQWGRAKNRMNRFRQQGQIAAAISRYQLTVSPDTNIRQPATLSPQSGRVAQTRDSGSLQTLQDLTRYDAGTPPLNQSTSRSTAHISAAKPLSRRKKAPKMQDAPGLEWVKEVVDRYDNLTEAEKADLLSHYAATLSTTVHVKPEWSYWPRTATLPS